MDAIATYNVVLDLRDGTGFFVGRLLWLLRRELRTRALPMRGAICR